MDLISIIVPIYKVEKYLKKCVDSIRKQTYTNIEIVLVDDGSPDDCGNMADDMAKEDNRIKVVHKVNGGLSDARNVGVQNASGKYIAFVDSDDYIKENYCQVLYDTLVQNDADISAVSCIMVREDDSPITNAGEEAKLIGKDLIIYENDDILKEVLNWKTFKNYAWNKLYRRELLENHKFPVGVNFEDIYFTYEVMSDVKKVAFKNEACYYYLKRTASISATCSEKNLNDFLDVVLYRFNGISKNKPELSLYNHYALLDAVTSISIKYIIANQDFESVNAKSKIIFNELIEYISKSEEEFLRLLNDFQKASLYMIKYNTSLFYSFLRERQSLKIKGLIK